MELPTTEFEAAGHKVKMSGHSDNEYIFRLIKENQQFYEHDLLDLIRRIPLKRGAIVDVGANIGNHSVFFALLMGRATHAFEVSPSNLTVLRNNVELNGVADLVQIHEYGLFSENTTCSIVENPENMGQTHIGAVGPDAENVIELKRLDGVMDDDEAISLLKIDVEGAELDVLKGAVATLSRCEPICVVEVQPGPELAQVADFFTENGYQPVGILGRSDTWVFVPQSLSRTIVPYINAILERRSRLAGLSNETRLRTVQAAVDRAANERRLLKSGFDVLSDQTRSQYEQTQAQYDQLLHHTQAQYEQLADGTQAQFKTLSRQSQAQYKKLLAGNQAQYKKLSDLSKRILEATTRPTIRNRAKGALVRVLRTLAGSRLVPVPLRHRVLNRVSPPALPTPSADASDSRPSETTGRDSDHNGDDSALRPPISSATGPSPPPVPLPSDTSYGSVVICVAYPGGSRIYGGEFIQTRAEAYTAHGHSVLVVEVNPHNQRPGLSEVGGLDVLRIKPEHLPLYLDQLKHQTGTFLTHSPAPQTLELMASEVEAERCIHWFHGFEVRDYRRLYFNHTTAELETIRAQLDIVNQDRMAAARECFADTRATKVFVSNFIRSVAERDTGQDAKNAHVIPNFIDGDYFVFRQKTSEQAARMLLIRSFARRNYANDIAIDAISSLATRPGFDDLQITIRGFGQEFEPLTTRISNLPNVDLREEYLTPAQIRALHGGHGIFLVPTRFDTQGVSMGEAMASGLASITNDTTAIPEFADSTNAVLVRPDDPQAYAEAMWEFVTNPGKLPAMSSAAAERVRRQCGFEQTIARELDLISR